MLSRKPTVKSGVARDTTDWHFSAHCTSALNNRNAVVVDNVFDSIVERGADSARSSSSNLRKFSSIQIL